MSESVKQGLRTHLATVASSATVSYGKFAQGTGSPQVLVTRTGYRSVANETLSDASDSLIYENFDIVCKHTTAEQAESIADDILDNLEGLNGNIGTTRMGSVTIENVVDDFEPDDYGGQVGQHTVTISAEIQHCPQ